MADIDTDQLSAPIQVGVLDLHKTSRYEELEARQAYYRQVQHDHREFSWDGIPRDAGTAYMNERLRPQGFVPSNAIPYHSRRPNAPYPLGRQVISSFTDMVFGTSGQPGIEAPADEDTAKFLVEILETSETWDTLQSCRSYAGACGSSAILLAVEDGEPTTTRLNTKDLWVVEWEDRPGWIPAAVVEQKRVAKQVKNEDGKIETVTVWRTRYWDREVSVAFEDVDDAWAKEHDDEPIPIVDVVAHRAGRCPVVWLQNTRETGCPEGETDIDGVEELADRLDELQSFAVRASKANTDPTLVYKDSDRNRKRNPIIRKGHGNRIEVSPEGDAKLLETSGSSIEMAWRGVGELKSEILQTASCVIVDPQTAGTYKSGEALQLLWRAMEKRCDRLRRPLKSAIRQICRIWIDLGLAFGVSSEETPKDGTIILPPRVDVEEIEPEDQPAPPVSTEPAPVGSPESPPKPSPPIPMLPERPEREKKITVHKVGTASSIRVVWSPYHKLTASQLQAMIAAMTMSNGQKPVLSQETATREVVAFLGRTDADEELDRIHEEKESGVGMMASLMGGGEAGDDEIGEPDPPKDEPAPPGEDGESGGE